MAKTITISLFFIMVIIALGVRVYDQGETITEKDLEIEAKKIMIETLENNLAKKDSTLNSLQKELENLQVLKNKTEEKLTESDSENDELKKDLQSLKNEIDSTIVKIDDYRDQIEDSMEWFTENSDISDLSGFSSYRRNLDSFCHRNLEDECRIRMACLPLVNNLKEGLFYKHDNASSDVQDHLQDLEDFRINKGGDCEDFSLLVVAELNYIKERCLRDTIVFETFEEGNSDYIVDFREDYLIHDARSRVITTEKDNFYIVCGTFPKGLNINNQISSEAAGHCLMGFSKYEVNGAEDVVRFLEDAELVEPQSGQYISKEEIVVPKDSWPIEPFYFSMVITSTDQYMFTYDDERHTWMGYNDYLLKIGILESELALVKRHY